MGRIQRIAAVGCAALGVLLIFLGFLVGYATYSVFNERAFAARIAASLDDPRFAEYVAEHVADAVIRTKPDLVGLRPLLVGVSRSVVTSPPFRAAVRRGARTMHHAILSGVGQEVILGVRDLDVLLRSVTETHPALAHRIPPQITAALARLGSLPGGERMVRLARMANRLRFAALALLLLGLLMGVMGVWLSVEKRRTIVRLGVALAILGLALAILARFGGHAVGMFARQAENSPALAALGGAFLSGLFPWAIGLGFAGLVLSAAAASLLEQVQLTRWTVAARRWLGGPQPLMRLRLIRGLLGAALGAALLIWPMPTITVVAWACGLVIGFVGLREAFVAALHLLPEIERRTRDTSRGRPRTRAIVMVTSIAVVLLGGGAWIVLHSNSTPEPQEILACNGSMSLCDRTLDQVVFPASHNSMGGADVPGWMFPNQNDDIPHQLADGIRGFLIDAHYGFPIEDKVVTDLADEKAAMAKYEAAIGKTGMDAVLRIRDRFANERHGEREVYMCHGFCELGAMKLVPVLREVRDFLVANPGEVLIFVIQDEGVAPADIARCFRESGLLDFVYRGPARPPWPTLRQMVETDQRVLVMAEHDTTGVPWYHPAFEVMQETPYEFHEPSEFTNRPNRGGTQGSLYLMNHWIESTPMPKPTNAAIVNAHDALMGRIQAFRRERGHYPNLVAVDFYATGDLLGVVRELNSGPADARAGGP